MSDAAQAIPHRAIADFVLRDDFYAFVRRVFITLNPGTAFVPNWHIEAICYAAMNFLDGDDLQLVVNVPPRSLKSIILSVALPAYLLGKDPTKRIICISYAANLTGSLARDTSTVMESGWYRRAFPNTIVARNPEEGIFTTAQGYRRATTIGGTLTGLGGDVLIVDDPIKPEDALSQPIREKTNNWLSSTLASRANDKRKSKTILVMQRVHDADPSSAMLERQRTRHLNLPAIADRDAQIPLGTSRLFEWREGEPLQLDREPLGVLERERERLGERNFAAQYLQAPVPLDGGMIKWIWFQFYDEKPTYKAGDRMIMSWDTAMTDGLVSDYSVCTVWLVRKEQYFLLNVIRERLLYPDLKRRIIELHRQHQNGVILIEDKGSGISVAQDLKQGGIGVVKIKPDTSKEMRASIASDQIEAGNVFLPREAAWLGEFQAECLAFPRGRHDDQVVSMSQAIIWNQTKAHNRTHTLFGSY